MLSCLLLCAIWLDVPFVSQEKNGCGAASIAMVMRYWQRAADASEIQRALYSPRARGIYASDLQHYFEQHGFQTFAIKGEWEDLRHHLEKGRPLIAALKIGHGDLHYVVITGLNPEEATVLMHDPARRKLLKASRSEFEKQWKGAGYWTLLALPR